MNTSQWSRETNSLGETQYVVSVFNSFEDLLLQVIVSKNIHTRKYNGFLSLSCLTLRDYKLNLERLINDTNIMGEFN